MGGEEHEKENGAMDVDKEEVTEDRPLDKVTQLQDYVDQFALKGTQSAAEKVKELAKTVIDTAHSIDQLVDQLPGLNTSEREQFQELERLQKVSNEEGERLEQAELEAQKWIQNAKNSLRTIANDKLKER